jgi:hypothetical protein
MPGRALVVGIDNYDQFDPLNYAERDAEEIARRLGSDDDAAGEPRFGVRLILNSVEPVTRRRLRGAVQELFRNSAGLDLAFYFAGHGLIADAGGYLVTADGTIDDYGLLMEELTNVALSCQANSVLILLDCCHAGAAGDAVPIRGADQRVVLRENQTIIAASLPMQRAAESALDGGLFTSALKDALDGGAADILGEVTVASVYSFVERRFSLWQQRPIAKSYVTRPVVLRKVQARLSRQELRRVVEFFPTPDHDYQMEPDHDPERDVNGVSVKPEVPAKVQVGRLFKRYRDAALIAASVPGEDFYYVAQRSHAVKLTIFGREYWRLVHEGRA